MLATVSPRVFARSTDPLRPLVRNGLWRRWVPGSPGRHLAPRHGGRAVCPALLPCLRVSGGGRRGCQGCACGGRVQARTWPGESCQCAGPGFDSPKYASPGVAQKAKQNKRQRSERPCVGCWGWASPRVRLRVPPLKRKPRFRVAGVDLSIEVGPWEGPTVGALGSLGGFWGGYLLVKDDDNAVGKKTWGARACTKNIRA